MLKKIKAFWRSFTFKESQLTVGSTFYGPANAYMKDDIQFQQGTDKWKESMYSCLLVVERIEGNKVHYFSYYIDPEGNRHISKHVKFIATDILLQSVNALKLWTEI